MFLAKKLGMALKKSLPKRGARGEEILLVQPAAASSADLASVREEIAKRVAGRALSLVECAMDAAEDGQFVAMKYLFEGVGLFPATPQAQSQEGDALARTLLQHLGLLDLPLAVTEDSKAQRADKHKSGNALK